MSGFNAPRPPEPVNAAVNLAGGKAYSISPELELVTLLLTSFVEDTAYEKTPDRLKRLKDVVGRVDPLFAAQAAVFARREFGMRSITHAVAGLLARRAVQGSVVPGTGHGFKHTKTVLQGPEWLKNFYAAIVRRPDDIGNIVAFYLAQHPDAVPPKTEKRSPILPNAMKKGFGRALSLLDAYQVGKWRGERRTWKLVDLMRLCHPKATAPMTALMKDEIRAEDTWERGLSDAGKAEAEDGQSKEDAVLDAKATQWYNLLRDRKLPYLALLRNLRNILEHAPTCLQMACEYLVDPAEIRKAKVFPFQYLTAITELVSHPDVAVRDVLVALQQAVETSTANVPRFPGTCLIALDCSGSMSTGMVKNAKHRVIDIAALFAAVMYKSQNAEMVLFGSKIASYNPPPSTPTAAMAADLARREMGGTHVNLVFQTAKKYYDRIFILSDGESWEGVKTGQGDLNAYVARLGGARPTIYDWDFSGGGTSQFLENRVAHISGFSVDTLGLLEKLELDRHALVNQIKGYTWWMKPWKPVEQVLAEKAAARGEWDPVVGVYSAPMEVINDPRAPAAPRKGQKAARKKAARLANPKAKKAAKAPGKAKKGGKRAKG